MRSKKILLTNFSHSLYQQSSCIRPDNEQQLIDYMNTEKPESILARGAGLSYNDSCFNQEGLIIDIQRLNHLVCFDKDSGIAACQGGVRLSDLFLLDPEFIPPVLPGTAQASLAGSVAHDVHGKNNFFAGSFGHHLVWLELIVKGKTMRCSPEENSELFYATIAGLGLTGIITRIALRLKKASHFVQVKNLRFDSMQSLINQMSIIGPGHHYQVAWLDLLNMGEQAILSVADHCDPIVYQERKVHSIPKLPFSLIKAWNMKWFNKLFFHTRKDQETLHLREFNNSLDKIGHWNRLYGPKGLIQFQAVFDQANATNSLDYLLDLIRLHKATPTLAVLKLFKQPGKGLLSFCKPGFTLAIDFIHNTQAEQAISAMNHYISEINGRIYLAKDLLLNTEEFKKMYENHQQFSDTLKQYQCSMRSSLSKRLGLTS